MLFEHQKALSVACCTGAYLWGCNGPRCAPGAGAVPSHVSSDGADGDASSHVSSDGPGAGAVPSHVGLDGTGDVESYGPGAGSGTVIGPAGELKTVLVLSLKQ